VALPTSTSPRANNRSRSLAALGVALAALCLPPAAAARKTAANWDPGAQRGVVAAGVMSEAAPGNFDGAAPISAQDEQQALAAIAARAPQERSGEVSAPAPAQTPAVSSSATITVTRFDALLVDQLGLAQTAAHVQQVAAAAGLKPPSYFGTEVVARYLGLRYDHPAGEDSLELYPWNPITRAEAAHSFAVVLEQGAWAVEGARQELESFALPRYNPAQLIVLRIAVSKIGMPYVWGGTSDGPETEFGVQSRGGYDCSGFVWRVYKTQLYPGGGLLPTVLRGRTTYQMSGEVPRAQRIGRANLEPADVIFFGSRGPQSQPSQVDHMGIYLGNGWFIHSSDYGVAVAPLQGWYRDRFAWARRPLAEAGLE
jgi:cell wall-associated NlpC family hydrolase